MKKTVVLSFLYMSLSLATQAQGFLEVMTFNIRLNLASDGINAWPNRKDKVASQILFHHTHIIGVQEALQDQMVDLQERLPQYKYVGVGRDDGKTKGEYSAIFYDTTRLQALQSNTFWLSLTPNAPGSKSWDAAYTRVVTWAKFKDRNTKKTFFVFNTHFDHMGKIARRESAHIFLKAIDSIAGKSTVIATGDFNALPTDEPIQIIVDKNDPLHLTDTKAVSQTPHYGPDGTFTAFQSKENSDAPIDHIFFKGKVKVLQHATLSESWQGLFSSDHFPVIARIIVQ